MTIEVLLRAERARMPAHNHTADELGPFDLACLLRYLEPACIYYRIVERRP